MKDKKRFLILTADAGFGHRSVANAVAAALEQVHGEACEVLIINPLDSKDAPFFLKDNASDYDKIVRTAPQIYRLGYEASDHGVPSRLMESVLIVSMYELMRDIVREHQPDAILTTYPVYQAPMQAYLSINKMNIPLMTVVTDLVTVHRIWFYPGVTACMVPTEEVRTLALENNLAEERIHLTGIPVSPKFADPRNDKNTIRRALGWEPNLPTFLAVGSRRVNKLIKMLHILNHFGAPLQVVAVAGKDKELYQQLRQMEWHVPVHIYDFVENIPDFLLASDAILCKAGGLIVTESLAAGLPILLIDVIPGQEEGNRDYVVKNKAGVMVETPLQLLEIQAHWMADDRRLMQVYARKASMLGHPKAAFDVAERLWRASQEKPARGSEKSGSDILPLVDLLTHHNIPWMEARKNNGYSD